MKIIPDVSLPRRPRPAQALKKTVRNLDPRRQKSDDPMMSTENFLLYMYGEVNTLHKEKERLTDELRDAHRQNDALFRDPEELDRLADTLRTNLTENRQDDYRPEPPEGQDEEDTRTLIPFDVARTRGAAPKTADTIPLAPNVMYTNLLLMGEMDLTLKTGKGQTIRPSVLPNAAMNPRDPEIADKLGKEQEAGILESYGVNWSREKCARDMLQNFSDGHGGTLEGVRLHIEEAPGGKYRVRIEGDGEYPFHMLEYIGATSKKDDDTVTGGFGEGAKILALVLLRQDWAEDLTFTSRNWAYEFGLMDTGGDERVLSRKLSQVPDTPGNALTFTTGDKRFVQTLLEGLNYFYHPANPDFQNPTVENEVGGFEVLGKDEKGMLYLANQRTDFNKSYDGDEMTANLPGMNLWMNRKGELRDRDRSAIDKYDLRSLVTPLVQACSDEELVHGIDALQDFWDYKQYSKNFTEEFVLKLSSEAASRDLRMDYPKNCLALAQPKKFEKAILQQLKQQGFTLCDGSFKDTGMQTVTEFWDKRTQKEGLRPTANEVLRINVLKEAAELFRQVENNSLIHTRDIEKPVYIFDEDEELALMKEHDGKSTGTTRAEYNGDHIWMSRQLMAEDFDKLVATYLHELTHKYGGDTSMTFSYKMTDWVEKTLAGLSTDTRSLERQKKLMALRRIWNDSLQNQ